MSQNNADLATLAALMRSSSVVVALTGAGISTESGLPDYRGIDGMWNNRRFEELASIRAFQDDPVEFWEFYRMRLKALAGARPNAAHVALARLQQHGAIAAIITQNVDGLHEAAGSDALEVHGTLRQAQCLQCSRLMTMQDAEELADSSADAVPRCTCGMPLKPAVTLFGEMLPQAFDHACDVIERCDLLLACGSSLAVAPVSLLPDVVVERGGAVAIINRGPTERDEIASVRIDAALGDALPTLADLLLDVEERDVR